MCRVLTPSGLKTAFLVVALLVVAAELAAEGPMDRFLSYRHGSQREPVETTAEKTAVTANWFEGLQETTSKKVASHGPAARQVKARPPRHDAAQLPHRELTLGQIDRELLITNFQLQQMTHAPGMSRSFYRVRAALLERLKRLRSMRRLALRTQAASL